MTITYKSALAAVMTAAEEMGFSPVESQVMSDGRMYRDVLIRAILCSVLRKHTNMSLMSIGDRIGKDRSTVIYLSRSSDARTSVDPIAGNLMLRTCQLLDVDAPTGLCLKAPITTAWHKSEAMRICPGAVRISLKEWRLPRPWMGETAESIVPWDRRPFRKNRMPRSGATVVPWEWSEDEKRRLDAWRKDDAGATQGAMYYIPSVSGSGMVRRRSKGT